MRGKRWTIASGVTALCGAVAACGTFGESPNETTTPDAGASDAAVTEPDATAPECAADLARDPENCGRCFRSCLGAACDAGQCEPIEVARNYNRPGFMRANATHLFVVAAAAVGRIPKAAGENDQVMNGLSNPRSLALDGETVYCTSDKGVFENGIRGNPKDVVERSPQVTSELAAVGGAVYGCGDNAAGVVTIAKGAKALGLGFEKPVVGCASLVAGAPGVLYVGADAIHRFVPGSPPGTTLHDNGPARRLAVDDAFIYSHDGSSPSVLKRSRTEFNAPPVTLDASKEVPVDGDLAVDDTHVYWTTGAEPGGVYRVPKNGGPVETIATGDHPKGIVVDEKAVYWTEQKADRIWKRAK